MRCGPNFWLAVRNTRRILRLRLIDQDIFMTLRLADFRPLGYFGSYSAIHENEMLLRLL